MKTFFHIILFLFFSSGFINSQVTQVWATRYGFFSEDQALAMAVDKAGNVYVTGSSEAFTPNGAKPDYTTIKYNSSGIQQWVQRYNGLGNDYDAPTGIAVDDTGNVYVTGTSNRIPFPGSAAYDVVTIKYNTNGVQQWLRRYDSGGDDAASAGIALDIQGNIYVGGRSDGIGYLAIKYNSNGDSLWVRTYNSGGNSAIAMAVDAFSNVYMTGAFGTSNIDWGTIKWNSQGIFQWFQIYDGPGNGADYPKAIVISDSGNVYVTGYVWGGNTWTDYATIKYNSVGVQLWVVFYNGTSNSYGYHDAATSISIDDSANVYVTGASYLNSTNSDIATIKYSTSGIRQWVARYNGPGNSTDSPYSIKLDVADNVYVTGYSYGIFNTSDYCTIKYSKSGVQQWVQRYEGPGGGTDVASALFADDTNVYVTGWSSNGGNLDYATIKYSQITGIKQISNEIPNEYGLFQNYPNPFNPTTKIKFNLPFPSKGGVQNVKLKIFDILGREVVTLVKSELKPGTYEIDFDGSELANGIYYYTLSTDGSSSPLRFTKKMVLIK